MTSPTLDELLEKIGYIRATAAPETSVAATPDTVYTAIIAPSPPKTFTGYLCTTAWEHEAGHRYAAEIYWSIAALKQHCECWRECGITEVTVMYSKTICDPGPE